MSYILDALRRLEQDKERTRKGTNPMEAVLVPDVEAQERAGGRRAWWVGIGVLLLAVAVGTTYWMTRRTVVLSTAQVQEEASPSLASTQSPKDRQTHAPLPETASRVSHLRPSNQERPAASGSGSAQVRPVVPPASAPERRPEEMPPPSMPEAETPSQPIEEPEESLTAAMSPDAIEDEVILPLEGDAIKINAIAYSRDRKNRFALVNLKTVHEGDQVEGFAVVEIEEDGVVFEQGGTKYRMSLGRR